jgi:hypothetical protein
VDVSGSDPAPPDCGECLDNGYVEHCGGRLVCEAETCPVRDRVTGPELAARVNETIRACVDADGRTQAQIAQAAWPLATPAASLQRLYRTLAGAWPSAETAADLARALKVEPGVFFA